MSAQVTDFVAHIYLFLSLFLYLQYDLLHAEYQERVNFQDNVREPFNALHKA